MFFHIQIFERIFKYCVYCFNCFESLCSFSKALGDSLNQIYGEPGDIVLKTVMCNITCLIFMFLLVLSSRGQTCFKADLF